MSTVERQRKRGSVTAFAAVLALTLMVLGIGFIIISLYMGGQRETKNATDAGALSVGKEVLHEPSVMLSPADNQKCFFDCTNDSINNNIIGDGKVNLNRINRVWSKALLMAINAKAASMEGNAGSGVGNAGSAASAAQDLSDALADKLTTAANLHGFFNDISTKNSTRMIGVNSSTKVRPGPGWQTSLMDRDAESNIELTGSPADNFYLPPGFNLPPSSRTQCTRTPVPGEVANTYFLKGYTPIDVLDRKFWQVPFKWNDKPHLVSSTPFNANKASAIPTTWAKPIPNAFSVDAEAKNPGATAETAMSWVLSNPRHPFKLAAPHSFLHIKVDEMKCHWYFYPVPPFKVEFGAAQTYDFNDSPKSMTGTPMPAGGVLCAMVSPPAQVIGLDIVGRSLDEVIFGPPPGNINKVEGYMVNRANEMISKPGVTITPAKLHSVLGSALTRAWLIAGEKDFYLFSKDGETLQCEPKSIAQISAPMWMPTIINNTPDGNETKIIDDAFMPGGIPLPHVPTPDPFCSPTPGVNWSWVLWDKDVYWKPGTGYNGSLGEIRVKRWSEVHTVGICNPF
ncbi:MAG: hypothetical protein C0508_03415 [Cyanobacteria bacterium PR.023]|nr:hypothetical protein [Cyanobacteria bacterium PR.023]MDQ5932775.1 hypothetical protein [Cyanobacteriota bacterium erpe_2018_sw_21hr_WHONDRS-SW48-000092_B_bin.40]